MTTISHKRRGGDRGVRRFLFIVLGVTLAAILFVWRAPITNVFWSVMGPILSARQELANQGEIARLEAELASTTTLLLDRNILFRENIELKNRLGRTVEGQSLLAAVILHPPGTPYDTLVLDVGEKEGVAIGDLVFASGSAVIGKITEVYSSVARATLFSAPGQVHDALIFAEGGSVPISLEGQGGGSFTGRLPQGTRVTAGETVLFPGIMPVFAARVSYVESPQGESFQTVFLQLPVNPFELRFVEVRKPQ